MEFNLDRDIVFFDLEATGLSVVKDKIVQIALIKYTKKGGEPIEKSMMINPGIPISEEAMNVHGITPKMLANKPTFEQVAQELHDFIGDSDLGGYNSNRYDVPMLMEEFARVGMELDISKRKLIDVQRIFYKMEPRTLSAALKFYCGEKLVGAHDALADVRATVDVLKGQLEKYKGVDIEDGDGNVTPEPVRNDMKAIHDFVNDLRYLEPTQKMKLNDKGVAVFSFGKYNNAPVGETLAKNMNYYNWIMKMEFSSQVKQLAKKYLKEYKEQNK
ncbi:MAG: DNA polymerase-3 subunit epsilon [Maribacter sp.]|jgi:DNA polymerase-3 subunit epsilon